jgi:hypothetical protein
LIWKRFTELLCFLQQVKNKAGLDKVLDDYNVGDRVLLIIKRGSEDLEVPIILEEKS